MTCMQAVQRLYEQPLVASTIQCFKHLHKLHGLCLQAFAIFWMMQPWIATVFCGVEKC